jgi:hypothetical protein
MRFAHDVKSVSVEMFWGTNEEPSWALWPARRYFPLIGPDWS